jgi:hypothetical protein
MRTTDGATLTFAVLPAVVDGEVAGTIDLSWRL